MKFIDIHSHLNFAAYDTDREAVLSRMNESGVGTILVGTQKDTSVRAVELAQKHDNLYAIVGIHPIHTDVCHHDAEELGGDETKEFTSRGEVFDYDFYKKLAMQPKVVGIGETGLDFYHITEGGEEKQRNAFVSQIKLAKELKKPLMLHLRSGNGRDAYDEALEILKKYKGEVFGDAHFFAGTIEQAKAFIELGFTVSFTGVITFAKQYKEVVEAVPLDMMHAETDSPYVSPEPYRGKRNEPTHVIQVVKKIAEIKNLPLEEVSLRLLKNAQRVWGV